MVKLRWLKDYKTIKAGEVAEASKKSAENFVSQGYAEYVVEEKKPNKKATKKTETEKPSPDYFGFDEFIKEFVDKTPVERLHAISEGSDKFNLTKTEAKQILNQKIKEIEDKEKLEKEKQKIKEKEEKDKQKQYKEKKKELSKKAGSKLTEKQFYILKKYASKDNELLQQAIDLGLESINMDDMMRAHCKIFLDKIMKQREQSTSLKEQVLSLLHRKCFDEATEMLVKELEEKNFIWTTKLDQKQEMYIYMDGIYEPNGETNIREQLRNIMEENYNEWLCNQVLTKIRADTLINPDKLFKEVNVSEIAVANGVLDINEMELKPFTPSKIFLSKLPVEFNIEAKCPLIDKFLSEVLACAEDKDVFYEIAGFGLYKEYFMEKAFMFVGNGRNGKTKSLELLKRLVGSDNCASVPLSAMDSSSPFVQGLWKRHFNLAGDISSKDLKDTGMFKQLTGRDLISANRKYLNVIEFMNYAKLVFACNELPRVYDYSDGFWDRWVLLEFPYKFVEQEVFDSGKEEEKKLWKIKDPNIIEKISTPQEMSGLLNYALAGLHRLKNNKRFSYTIGTSEVKNKWIRKADSFMAFCMDCVEEDYDSKLTKKEVRRRYKEYCNKHKVGGVSDKSIKATLQELFGVMEEYSNIFGEHQEWVWTGIKWKEGVFN